MKEYTHFGMMSIQEDDQILEFLFGQEMEEQDELKELKYVVSKFKIILNSLSHKYLSTLRIPKRENVGSSNPTNQEHNHPQITGPPPPFDTKMLELPDTSPLAVPHSLSFRINGMNNLISQISDQPVLNIQCQSRAQIQATIQLLSNWVLYKRTQDTSITGQQLAL